MVTILYAHPYAKSFNHAILESVESKLKLENKDYEVIDLYADGFNPAFEAESLRLYSKGESADPLIKKYIEILLRTDSLFMIFPVWWGMMPAIVKGFFDKVMLVGTAYTYNDAGALVPDKINVERTVMFTTSQSPTELFEPFFNEYFKNRVLDAVGFRNLEWYNCSETSLGSQEHREKFLTLVSTKVLPL